MCSLICELLTMVTSMRCVSELKVPGISVRALGSCDGIGDCHFQAWQGRASLMIPLHCT
jgi:hypothetical protein